MRWTWINRSPSLTLSYSRLQMSSSRIFNNSNTKFNHCNCNDSTKEESQGWLNNELWSCRDLYMWDQLWVVLKVQSYVSESLLRRVGRSSVMLWLRACHTLIRIPWRWQVACNLNDYLTLGEWTGVQSGSSIRHRHRKGSARLTITIPRLTLWTSGPAGVGLSKVSASKSV